VPSNTTAYYDRTAGEYDACHAGEQDLEHIRALERSLPILRQLRPQSVLDVGCGTGRSLEWFARQMPSIALLGIDPSQELIKIAQAKLPTAKLSVGVGERLPFPDASVDIAVATGIMHHVDGPSDVMREMLRVAAKAVVISDHNNFAFGGITKRYIRRWLAATKLLGLATFVKQGFRRQGYSDGDGWWYPYSLLSDFGVIARATAQQYVIPTSGGIAESIDDFQLVQSHLAVIGLKAPLEASS
jgi:ubiquinone/menaquinone biosynthesis C-methylase UbiE